MNAYQPYSIQFMIFSLPHDSAVLIEL